MDFSFLYVTVPQNNLSLEFQSLLAWIFHFYIWKILTLLTGGLKVSILISMDFSFLYIRKKERKEIITIVSILISMDFSFLYNS